MRQKNWLFPFEILHLGGKSQDHSFRKKFLASPRAVLRNLLGYFMDNKEKRGMKSLPGSLFSVKKESKFPICESKWK